jgi:hypothetical protein
VEKKAILNKFFSLTFERIDRQLFKSGKHNEIFEDSFQMLKQFSYETLAMFLFEYKGNMINICKKIKKEKQMNFEKVEVQLLERRHQESQT